MNNWQMEVGAQVRAAQMAEAEYQQTMTEDSGLEWFQRNWELGNLLQKQGALPQAEEVYHTGLAICLELLERFNSRRAKRRLAVTYKDLGEVLFTQNRRKEAQQYYQQCIEYCRNLFQTEDTNAVEWRAYYAALGKMGELHWAEKRYDDAQYWFQEGIRTCRNLLLEHEDPLERANLALLYQLTGNFYQGLGNPRKAALYYQQCIEQLEQLLRENWQITGIDVPVRLSEGLESLSSIFQQENNHVQTERCQQRCVELWRQRLAETRGAGAAFKLSNALEDLGITLQLAGNPEASMEPLLECLSLRRQLYQMEKSEMYFHSLGLVYYNLSMGTEDGRRRYAMKAYEVFNQLCKEHPGTELYVKQKNTIVRSHMTG